MSYGVRNAQELPQVLIHHLHQAYRRLRQLQALHQVYAQATNFYMHKTEFTWQVLQLHIEIYTNMWSFVVHAIHHEKAYQVYFLTQQTEHLLDFPLKSMVDLLKAAQNLRRHARTSRDFMEAEPIGLPLPQVVACAHSQL